MLDSGASSVVPYVHDFSFLGRIGVVSLSVTVDTCCSVVSGAGSQAPRFFIIRYMTTPINAVDIYR
jgi:hypothetical protein